MPQEEQLQLEVPGGWKAKIKGKDNIYYILILLIIVFQIYTSYVISNDHKEISKELRINTYILSLPPDRRPELIPPSEVWERMRARNPLYKNE